jgi:AcrR family transcriptional regulator
MARAATTSSQEPISGRRLAALEFIERERQLLRHARRLLREGGYDYLTIKRLAETCGLARITLYKHFAIRQDIVLKLAIQSTSRRADMVERAALFRGHTRERLVAIADVFRRLLPHHIRHELLVFEQGIREKASPDLLRELETHEDRILSTVIGVIRDAVASGDLSLPDDLPPERLGFALLQLDYGAHVLMQRPKTYGRFTHLDAYEVVFDFGIRVADSLGWKPLSSEHDYVTPTLRMWRTLFPDELERFGITV